MESDTQPLTYSVSTNSDEYTNDELSASLFEKLIDRLNSDAWDFIVLAPSKPVKESTFLQVGAPLETTDLQLTVEIGFGDENSGVKMYRSYTKDKSVALQYLIDYWQEQKIPDISSWEDVSDEIPG